MQVEKPEDGVYWGIYRFHSVAVSETFFSFGNVVLYESSRKNIVIITFPKLKKVSETLHKSITIWKTQAK
jgi:hypothetical protein